MSGIGAFFDIDGTLLEGPSLEWRLALRLAVRGELRVAAGVQWLKQFAGGAMCLRGGQPVRLEMFDHNKAWLAGLSCTSVRESACAIAQSAAIRSSMIFRLKQHAKRRHALFFLSGTLAPLATAFSERLAQIAAIGVIATRLESQGDEYTGRIVGEPICGNEKAVALRRCAQTHGLDLADSFAYGNSIADRAFLEAVGNPLVVAPDRQLAEIARAKRWVVLQATQPEAGDPFCGAVGISNESRSLEI